MGPTEKQDRESGEAPRAEQPREEESSRDVPDEHVIERTLPQKPKDEA